MRSTVVLPPALLDHADGLRFSKSADGVAIRTGRVAAPTFDAMRRAIAVMADTGCDMIVDDVVLGPEDCARRIAEMFAL